jgi:hypothetical protein
MPPFQLNLPIYDQLAACKNLLIAGMGGGFDIFSGLPIYFELQARGQTVHLANFSFSLLHGLTHSTYLTDSLVGVTADESNFSPYFPEAHLSRWFRSTGQEVTIWAFEKTGVRPLLANYRALVEHLAIDGILLIDGGVDSLVRGNEAALGTVLEDATSLAAVNALTDVPTRLMACIGFGIERDMAYAHILENIADLAHDEVFLGTCSLLRQMESYQRYEAALLAVQATPYQDPSVINSSIVSAVQGHYGNYHLTEKTRNGRNWISPLMPIYWFFDLPGVAYKNLFLNEIMLTDTFNDVFSQMAKYRRYMPSRQPFRIPLT